MLVVSVGGPALQDEAAVAIAAVDISLVVNLEIDARVAEGGAARDFARAIAGEAGGGESGDFGRWQPGIRR